MMLPNLIVPVLNRYDLLERMLASVDYPIAHLLIIDNGAAGVLEDVEVDLPDVIEHTTYLPMPSNLGVAASWNLGIKLFPMDNRWTFASNDMWFEPGQLEKLAQAKPSHLTVIKDFPHWHAFTVGEEVVERIGLFDEAFYPAYFEDVDYMNRCEHHKVPTTFLDIKTGHDNSSTIMSDTRYRFLNSTTWKNNRQYYDLKTRLHDHSQGNWALNLRRENDWPV
jgi:GT2 family glycosyltransferase